MFFLPAGSSLSDADGHLQNALISFPGVLLPLLDKCSIEPDPAVSGHKHFMDQDRVTSPALATLQALYVARCYHCWKEPEVVPWLERNCRDVLGRVDQGDRVVDVSAQARKTRYQVI